MNVCKFAHFFVSHGVVTFYFSIITSYLLYNSIVIDT